jgi:glycosyltransferase involved in cell wall biosynthesis
MKIAQVAPLFESVPPKAYGGTERVVAHLTEALIDLGHEVTLFASGDSVTRARHVAVGESSLRLNRRRPDPQIWHTILLERAFAQADDFDVLHFHTDYLHLPLARRCRTPCVTTLHGRLDIPDMVPLLREFREQALVSISDNQRRPVEWANWRATVHHGLPPDMLSFSPKADGYFAFLGRISPEKRVDRAVDIALACGRPLRVAAKVDEADRGYYERIKPLLDHPLVEFVGEIDDAHKSGFLGGARALLFPIDWPEPFGIVMIEAFACGTPVIAYAGGSVREVVDHGVTGYIVHDQQEAIAAAREIDAIDRHACRQAFERRFTARTMAERYLDVYKGLLQ